MEVKISGKINYVYLTFRITDFSRKSTRKRPLGVLRFVISQNKQSVGYPRIWLQLALWYRGVKSLQIKTLWPEGGKRLLKKKQS